MSSLRALLPVACLCLSASAPLLAQHVALPAAQRIAVRATAPSASRPAKHGGALASVPTQQYSHGEPTAAEQYILELINRARANPRAEGDRLVMTTDQNVRGAFGYFNVDTAAVRAQFASYPSRPPLAFNAKLITSARRHTADMVANNFQGHTGTDGSSFDQRIEQAGYTVYTALGENVSAYAYSTWYAHVGFNVDWGVPDLGHRHNIMNFADDDDIYTEFGVAVTDLNRPAQQGQVGPLVVTQQFAKNNDGPFLVGVVYNDANANGFYDVGEGLGNVKVMPSSGTYYALTSASGGYAIPVKTAGANFTVTFSEGPLTSTYTRNVVVAGANVKLDLAPTAAPAAVITLRPIAGAIVTADSARFSWRRPSPTVDRYRLQLATDSMMSEIVFNDSAITDTARTISGLINGGRYFWRVQAHNSEGWGEMSAVQSFRVVFLPAAVTLVSPADDGRVPTVDARFVWNRPAGPVTGYTFELANDPGMASIVTSDTSVADTFFVVSSLGIDRYFWRVRAKNDAGWGPFSEIREVEAATAGVESEAGSDGLHVSHVYPNPAAIGDRVVATFTLERRAHVRLDIVDALGRVVAFIDERDREAGAHEILVDTRALAQGGYFVRMAGASGASATPLVIIAPRR